jgi:hypothetical protein
MGKITELSIIKRTPEMITSNIDGEIVMMSIDNGEYYGLDEIGSRIWALIETPIEVKALFNILLTEFEVDETECKTDTLDFLNDLYDKKLVTVL